MGTDPWADDSWESEPDLRQVPLTVTHLSCYPTQNSSEMIVTTPPDVQATMPSGYIFPVDETAWKNWENELVSPDPVFLARQMELVLQADVAVNDFKCQGSVLVDTGCRIPLLFRKGLIPSEFLESARRSITIRTADGTPMVGGTNGCKMKLTLPVAGLDGSTQVGFVSHPFWGYEAAIRGNDLILGYPFLKIFKLVVDCPSDILRSTSISNTGLSSLSRTRISRRRRSFPCSFPTRRERETDLIR